LDSGGVRAHGDDADFGGEFMFAAALNLHVY